MSEHRRQILQMLAEGKITPDEAERLIAAAEQPSPAGSLQSDSGTGTKSSPKYLRVQVDSEETGSKEHGEGPTRVNVRVPMQLLRAGVRLAGLIPPQALHKANDAIHRQGIPFDLSQIKPENLEEIVEQLNDLSVDVDQRDESAKVRVRVFCE
ncbi:MAG TPA: hypothetical protein VGG14_15810 [Candidatus Sulfotelmatobacter sp.]|jgi:hypothetical protein